MLNHPNSSAYETMMTRRSVKAKTMIAPGPTKDQIDNILKAAMRVPDHGKLTPWRFIVLEGLEREKLGSLIGEAMIAEKATDAKTAERMEGYAVQGPTLVVAIYSPKPSKSIPEWEQTLSTGAACMNMLNAANALGLASVWLTGWASYSPHVHRGLGLDDVERIAGFFFFGQHGEDALEDRPRPTLDDKVIQGMPT